MFKKVTALMLALCLTLTVFAGCGGDKSSAAPSTAPDASASESAAPDAKPATASDTFVWNLGADPKTWDPGLNNASDGGHVINNLFEGLMRDIGGGKLDYAIAESHTVSEDLLTYTFKIRPDVKWSDGKPLTAKDFEFSWKRVCDPATASEYSFIMAPYIVGGEDFLNGKGSKDDMGVKAIDDATLEVKLNF
ncbi:MAG: ABC transporter substrate-binding protein, partial [Oscillospiraceae bacterium]